LIRDTLLLYKKVLSYPDCSTDHNYGESIPLYLVFTKTVDKNGARVCLSEAENQYSASSMEKNFRRIEF
jgi:hypothetical protein